MMFNDAWIHLHFKGVRFDPDLPATLRLEFAKSNTKVQKPKHPAQNALATATQQYIQIPRMFDWWSDRSSRSLDDFLEELGAAFFPTEAWGQPLTFDLGPAGLHHPALLHTAIHGPPMVGDHFLWICFLSIVIKSISSSSIFFKFLNWLT